MNIESAKYQKDENGELSSILIVHDSDQQCAAPFNGMTWVNTALNAWIALGNQIEAAD